MLVLGNFSNSAQIILTEVPENEHLTPSVLLDYEIILANPKRLVGFSDITALQLGLLKKTGLITYTGFTLTVQRNALVETKGSSARSRKLLNFIKKYSFREQALEPLVL